MNYKACAFLLLEVSFASLATNSLFMELEQEFVARHGQILDDELLFEFWQHKYARNSSRSKFKVFHENLQLIRSHNSKPNASWKMDANRFADLTWDEFKGMKLASPQHCSATNRRKTGVPAPFGGPLPDEMDWRNQNVVTPVKDQNSCGSCWTFSTSGVVESHYAIATKKLVSLSEQQLVDCAGAFNNHGCNGGLPSQAMEYIHYTGGLETEESYKYTGRNGKCDFDRTKVVAQVAQVVNISQGDENSILEAVGTIGPVSIAYDCTLGFQFYHSGVYDGWFCGNKPSQVNHAVLAVGYGHDEKSGKDYWLVKNSWGVGFGLDGYFKIVRGKNKCGLADCASYPVMAGSLKDAASILV